MKFEKVFARVRQRSKIKETILAAAVLLSCTRETIAATVGFTDFSSSAQTALWDTFSTQVISGQAATSSIGFTSVSMSQSSPNIGSGFGPFPAAGGDYFYDAGAATSWTLDFTSSAAVPALVLQIKLSNSSSSYYTPTLSINGGTAIGATLPPTIVVPGDTVAGFGPTPLYVATYTWDGLTAAAGSTFELSFARATGSHVVSDGFQVAAVPEPSTYALLVLGLGALAVLRYRRQENKLGS